MIYGWRHTFSSLANYDFLCLWLSMVLLWGGFYMQPVARGLLVYDITESSTILGLVSAGGNLPLAAVGLFGGAIADRMDRKSLIQIGHGAIAVTRLVGAVSITMGFVTWELLLVAFACDALGARPTMGMMATGLLVTSMVVLTTQRRIRELN